jgi:2-oxoglutarate dehydrogenase E2 component (dihydrolipoamide succinyltransferase)
MANVDLIMPKMGESVAEATIIKWTKNIGDRIEADETVLEIATDKVDSEVPSSISGILVKQLFQEGDVVQVGKVVAVINTETASADLAPEEVATEQAAALNAEVHTAIASQASSTEVIAETTDSDRFYSPLVRTIAKEEGISIAELDTLKGTGKDGRVTKNDILAYLPHRGKALPSISEKPAEVLAQVETPVSSAPKPEPKPSSTTQSIQAPVVSVGGSDEIIEMDRMRKLIADHMVMSKHVSPHVTSFVEADVTNIVQWRERVKADFEKREKEKLTFTPIFIEAVARAIKDFPMVNVSVDGTKIIIRKNINIGMATALPSGNLIVPVIKNADQKNLVGLTKSVNDLSGRARINKLVPDEIQGGTFTISNVGTFGNVMGTPIINQPQVAILAVGAIKKKPAVIETPQGDVIAIRHFMFLSLSYDHRVVDGSLGGSFLRRIGDYLEQFDINRPF